MGLLFFIVFGLVVGLLARAIMPGTQKMGIVRTTLLGMAGSLVGGFLGSLISNTAPLRVKAAGFIGSIVGALIVLGIAMMMGRRTAT